MQHYFGKMTVGPKQAFLVVLNLPTLVLLSNLFFFHKPQISNHHLMLTWKM